MEGSVKATSIPKAGLLALCAMAALQTGGSRSVDRNPAGSSSHFATNYIMQFVSEPKCKQSPR